MENEIKKNVITFFGKYSQAKLDENTEINNELGLLGDDADAMLFAFMKRFNVNFENVDFDKYFVPEPLLKYWYYKWFNPEKLRRKPLTLGHMVEVAKKGYWFEPQ